MARQSEVTLWIRIKQQGAEAIAAIKKSVGEFGDSLLDLKTLAAEAAAVVLEQLGEKLVKAFADSEQGIIKLNAALRVTGRYSDEGTDKIQAMAEKMSHLTDVSKDSAIKISATLAQYTRTLTPEQLANLQQAVIGLHALTGQDVEGAAMRVARALEGQGNSLKRVGVEIDNTMTEQQRYQQVMEKLGPQFKIAEEMNKSLNGQMAQFGHATEELRKALGQIIVESVNMAQTGPGLTKTVEGWTESIKNNMGLWVKWGSVIVEVFKLLVNWLIVGAKNAWDFDQILYNVFKSILVTLWDLVKGFGNGALMISAAFQFAWAEIKDKAQDFYNWMVDNVINKIIEKFNEFSPIKLPLLEHMQADTQSAVTATKAVLDTARNDFQANFRDIGDSWKNTWGVIGTNITAMRSNARGLFTEFQHIIDLWNAPVKPNAAFNISHKGGGANLGDQQGEDPLTAMRNLEQALKAQKQQFDENAIGVSKYVANLQDLAPKIATVMASLSGKDLVAFQGVIGNLQKELEKLGYTYQDGGIRMLTVTEALKLKVAEATKGVGTLNTTIANMAYETFQGFFKAIQTAFQALVDGSKNAGQAFAEALLASLAQVAQGFGEFFLGRAAGALAEALLPSNVVTGLSAGGVASAAKFTAAAAAMFALSGVLGGLAKGSSASGGGGSGSIAATQQTNSVTNTQQPGTIIVEGGLLDMSNPQQADALANAITTLAGRRIIILGG